eukprot:CAMPEP_0116014806 /NCGR_PEP_ID=MMETSP0321-20121206/6472_1 /TAXON_ID=163516 /ORGANISM="Leptocylindrus danicus var. danicus, Strain B650" /LENGTH=1265 /DNA_ID=CAMNT_0003484479 /DNA_START=588 /DNA_END=4385 /DNA_ORIENTATION=-
MPILGKHTDCITCGAWSDSGLLALGSSDCTITISDKAGDTMHEFELREEPLDVMFSPVMEGNRFVLSINVNGECLALFDSDGDKLEEIFFREDGGRLVSHCWIDECTLLVGTDEGMVFTVQCYPNEPTKQKICSRVFTASLAHMCLCGAHAIAAAGDCGIVQLFNFQNGVLDMIGKGWDVGDDIETLSWCHEAQALIVCSKNGCIVGFTESRSMKGDFMTSNAISHAHFKSNLAYTASDKEVLVVDTKTQKPINSFETRRDLVVSLALTRSFVAIATTKCLVQVYSMKNAGPKSVFAEYQLSEKIKGVAINESFVAILMENGVLDLRSILPDDGQQIRAPFHKCFSESNIDEKDREITCMSLSEHFLVFVGGCSMHFFSLEDWTLLSQAQLSHQNRISSIFPNHISTRVLVVDEKNDGYLYNPVTSALLQMSDFPISCKHVMWDRSIKDMLSVHDGSHIHAYVHASTTMRGNAIIMKVGSIEIDEHGSITQFPKSFSIDSSKVLPVVSNNGNVSCISISDRQLTCVRFPLYSPTSNVRDEEQNAKEAKTTALFSHHLSLLQLEDAWKLALVLDRRDYFLAIANKAMHIMDIEMALKVYRQLGDAGMVTSLQSLVSIENVNFLAAHLAVLFMDYDLAEEKFIASGHPRAALEMRIDLMQWEEALKLAELHDPRQVSNISLRYAKQLEARGEYDNALEFYELGLNPTNSTDDSNEEELRIACKSGLVRTIMHLGDIRRGIRLAKEINDSRLYAACADILVKLEQFSEAAYLFELSQLYDKAAELYVDSNAIPNILRISDKVTSQKLLCRIGNVLEREMKFREAIILYQKAHDHESVVRLYLDELEEAESAFELVRENKSLSAAFIVAQYCQECNDYAQAIEFLLIGNERQRAIDLARDNSCMDIYVEKVGNPSLDDAQQIAQFYEAAQELIKAGDYYCASGNYGRAFSLFLEEDGDIGIQKAIDVVGLAEDDDLTNKLIDILLGEVDGVPRDPLHVFRLYVSLRNYSDAVKTALLIVQQEQLDGDYSKSHYVVSEAIKVLRENAHPIPFQLKHMFILLHTYHLVKTVARRGDHECTSRLLLRLVPAHIGNFPRHRFQLFISTIVECQKAGLKASSYKCAELLWSNKELRMQLEKSKFEKKVQSIIRRPNVEEEEQERSLCPITGSRISCMDLECYSSRSKELLPMCVVSGKHIVLDDFCTCPISGFAAIFSEYLAYLRGFSDVKENENAEGVDPVFQKPISVKDLSRASPEDALRYVNEYNMEEVAE